MMNAQSEEENKDSLQNSNKIPDIPGFKPVTFQQKERQEMFNRSDPYVPPEKDTRFQVNKPDSPR